MVQNHNYFWINLIIYIGAHWSLILCKFHSVLWFFYYLKYKPICRGNGISFSRNGGIVNFQGPLHRNTISNTKTGTLKKIYNNQVNTELRRGKGNFRILGKFFSIYTFFCPIPSQPVVILKKAPYIPTVGHWPLVGKEQFFVLKELGLSILTYLSATWGSDSGYLPLHHLIQSCYAERIPWKCCKANEQPITISSWRLQLRVTTDK